MREFFRKEKPLLGLEGSGGGLGFFGGGAPEGMSASGGIISDYTDPGPGTIYRAHIFTSSSTFVVSSIGDLPAQVDYLVIGGGGGGGRTIGGGGGAGGYRTSMPEGPGGPSPSGAESKLTVTATTYTITVGAGGGGGAGPGSPAVTYKNGESGGSVAGPVAIAVLNSLIDR